ncbi:MAG: heterodisulfide reductase-related iron-sulfur binding cluster [Acidimicrobiales bacterium]
MTVPMHPQTAPVAHSRPMADLLSDCIHCGFCLPACPTYGLWGEETESPRGRIHLMAQYQAGKAEASEISTHIDNCLGCLGCVTACPSGVRYDELIMQTRSDIESGLSRSRRQRLERWAIFALFPHRRRLRVAALPLRLFQRLGLPARLRRSKAWRRLPPSLVAAEMLAPTLGRRERLPAHLSPAGPSRAAVQMLLGCVQDAFFPGVNAATARVLVAEGCRVDLPKGQGCCGALSLHMGRSEEAKDAARRLMDAFGDGDAPIVVNAAGCGSAMKEYGLIFEDDPIWRHRAAAFSRRVRDFSEFLVELGPSAMRHPIDQTVAYHDACHLSHAQRIRSQPRQLLAEVPGLTTLEVPDAEICCGSAGVYNIVHPEPAGELGRQKAGNVALTGATTVVAANPGCLMQIAAHSPPNAALQTFHIAQVLDASIRGVEL